ncbi:hypothetical protein Tco_1399164, partial [Tanacetum coccineum]
MIAVIMVKTSTMEGLHEFGFFFMGHRYVIIVMIKVFASSVSDGGNIIRRIASFSVSLYLNISHIPRNGDCETESRSDNTVGSTYGFVIYGIEVLKGNEKVMEVIDVENWRVDNSRLL